MLRYHLSWSCFFNFLLFKPDSHRLLTRRLLGFDLGWSCRLISLSVETRLSQAPHKPLARVSLRLVLSVKFSCIDTRLSQATNQPPVRVSLRLVLLSSSLLGCHLAWSCLLNSFLLTPNCHRLLTSPLLGCNLGWFCLLNYRPSTPDSHRLLTSPC